MGVRRDCCASQNCTHARFFCQSCNSKACSSCGLKGTEQWIAEQQHILPGCDWEIRFMQSAIEWLEFCLQDAPGTDIISMSAHCYVN
jgi:hypothetical protein